MAGLFPPEPAPTAPLAVPSPTADERRSARAALGTPHANYKLDRSAPRGVDPEAATMRPTPPVPRLSWLAAAALALSLVAPAAQAQVPSPVLYEYFDAHPVPGPPDGDVSWCLDEGRHGHDYALDPEQEPVYVVEGVRYYVGDSVVQGAPVEAVWYWGAHPLLHLGSAWCVLDGPHAHYWRPWWRTSAWYGPYWLTTDGYYRYAGPYDDGYRYSYDRWYVRQHAIHVRYVERPRYAPRFRETRHPAVVYSTERRALPRWDSRSSSSGSRVEGRSSSSRDADPRRSRDEESRRERSSTPSRTAPPAARPRSDGRSTSGGSRR